MADDSDMKLHLSYVEENLSGLLFEREKYLGVGKSHVNNEYINDKNKIHPFRSL